MIEGWKCLTCASPWHMLETPPDDASCMYCGGEIDLADLYWQWPGNLGREK